MVEQLEVDERWKVLVVGNNPIELGLVFDRLQGIARKRVITEMAFDLQSALKRLVTFRPQHILIDDNVGTTMMKAMVKELLKMSAREVPITVLKNSNYHESIAAGVMNYVLKQNLNSELLYRELLNSIHFLKTSLSWQRARKKRRGMLRSFFQSTNQI